VSIWSFVNDQQDKYLNPLYVHSVHQQHVLFPVASLRRIVPWTGYYLRWNPSTIPQVNCKMWLTAIKAETITVITNATKWPIWCQQHHFCHTSVVVCATYSPWSTITYHFRTKEILPKLVDDLATPYWLMKFSVSNELHDLDLDLWRFDLLSLVACHKFRPGAC